MHRRLRPSAADVGCCVFLRRPSSLSRLGYRALPPPDGVFSDDEGGGRDDAVRVVVGKDRKVFHVDRFVLDKDLFRVLMEVSRDGSFGKAQGLSTSRRRKRQRWDDDDDIFLDVDAILFEHMLWLACNESSVSSSLFKLNLKEIIEFYSQDN